MVERLKRKDTINGKWYRETPSNIRKIIKNENPHAVNKIVVVTEKFN